jgi:hypothetical protein
LLGAEKEGRYIAVEIKSFTGSSQLNDFHTAVGQFVNYRLVLAESQPERVLYLALPEDVFLSLLDTTFGRLAKEKHQLKLIIFDEVEGKITRWIE